MRKEIVNYSASHNLYSRTMGMDLEGKKPRFWLGSDKVVAERRAERLELLWSQVEADWGNLPLTYPDWLGVTLLQKPPRPSWGEITLAAARRIAKGEMTFCLPRVASWSPYDYALRIAEIQRRFSAIQFVPQDEGSHRVGVELHRMDALADIQQAQEKLSVLAGQTTGQTLYMALDAYVENLTKLPDRSGWYRTQSKQVKRLKEAHPDLLLCQLGLSKIEEMVNYWRHRPIVRGKTVAASTARNMVIQLRMCLKWIHRQDAFAWKKPDGFEDVKQSIKDADGDVVHQIETFTVDDLRILWQHAAPMVRLKMLLALNCGFKFAEIASLTLAEIHLEKPYPGIVRVDRPEGTGNWIVRFRRKTKVYGEFQLWDETAAGIRWAMGLHKGGEFLLQTRGGYRMDMPTKSGNKSDRLHKGWAHLYKQVGSEVKYLPFKHLEKTASEWIRAKHGAEVASLFVSHGKPVKSDHQLEVYATKPFGRLFTALKELHEYLKPMFCVAAPWDTNPRTSPETIQKVLALRAQGKKLTEIAAELELHWVTVGRICRKNADQAKSLP